MANVSDMSDTCSRNENCTIVKEEVETSENKEENCNGESKCKIEKEDIATSSNNCEENKSTPVRFRLRTSMLNPTSSGSPGQTPTKPFVLQPPKLSHPSIKKEKEDDQKTEECTTPKPSEKEEKPFTPLDKSSVSFLPLGGEASTPSQASTFSAATTPSLGFVFGQNIHEKVEAATPAESTSIAAAEPSPSQEPQEVTTNGTSSESLFLSQVPKECSEKTADASKSLSEAAREYEEARAVKRRYEEVPVLTGEEEEANVIQYGEPIPKSEAMDLTNKEISDFGGKTLKKRCIPKKEAKVLPVQIKVVSSNSLTKEKGIDLTPMGQEIQELSRFAEQMFQRPLRQDVGPESSSNIERNPVSHSEFNSTIDEAYYVVREAALARLRENGVQQPRNAYRTRESAPISVAPFNASVASRQHSSTQSGHEYMDVPQPYAMIPCNSIQFPYDIMAPGVSRTPPTPAPRSNLRPPGVCQSYYPAALKLTAKPIVGNMQHLCTCVGVSHRNRIPEDKFDAFGRYVTTRFRSLENRQRILAEQLISEVLFEAEMGMLSIYSSLTGRERGTGVASYNNTLHVHPSTSADIGLEHPARTPPPAHSSQCKWSHGLCKRKFL